MVRPLAEYFSLVYGSDAHPYGFGAVRDFLFPGDEPAFDWIITNPPFRLAEQFAHTAIDRATEGVALLVRTAFLEGMGRYSQLFSQRKPTAILQFTERVPMVKGRVDEDASSATAYCWIVWRCRPHKPSAAPCRYSSGSRLAAALSSGPMTTGAPHEPRRPHRAHRRCGRDAGGLFPVGDLNATPSQARRMDVRWE